MKRWALWIALVIGGFNAFAPIPYQKAQMSHHSGCFCRDCAGGDQCCCARVDSGVANTVTLNPCDRAAQQVAAGFSMPRWAHHEPLLVPAPLMLFAGYHPFVLSPISRSVAPRDPPPRAL